MSKYVGTKQGSPTKSSIEEVLKPMI